MTRLDERSSKAEQEVFILIAGFGLGGLFQVPLIGEQSRSSCEFDFIN